jgi:hypothetical protein
MFLTPLGATDASDLTLNGSKVYLVTHDHGDPRLVGTAFLQTREGVLYFDPVYDLVYGSEIKPSYACSYPDNEVTDDTGYKDHLKRVQDTLRALTEMETPEARDPTLSYPPSNSKITCIVIGLKVGEPTQMVLGVKALGTVEVVALPTVAPPGPTLTPTVSPQH